ncbi:MAG: hypothetical protein JWM18_1595 [Chloroflexi bacterium]|nr:hypothetical protein [Chloroflexota bacterium]
MKAPQDGSPEGSVTPSVRFHQSLRRVAAELRLPATVGIVVFVAWSSVAGIRPGHAVFGAFLGASIAYAMWAMRFGLLAVVSLTAIISFYVALFFVPIEDIFPARNHPVEFFTTTAQVIPVLLIAFGIESGVVRAEPHVQAKVVAVYLAGLLTVGELAALMGLAAGDRASQWHHYCAVAAIGGGMLAIIGVMVIPERSDAQSVRDDSSRLRRGKKQHAPRAGSEASGIGLPVVWQADGAAREGIIVLHRCEDVVVVNRILRRRVIRVGAEWYEYFT